MPETEFKPATYKEVIAKYPYLEYVNPSPEDQQTCFTDLDENDKTRILLKDRQKRLKIQIQN